MIAQDGGRRAAAAIGDEEIRRSVAAIEVTDATIAAHVDAWEGVGDAEGAPVQPTPELVNELLRTVPGVRDLLNAELQAMAEAWLAEKKTSRSSPPGNAEAEPPTAPNAGAPVPPAPTASQD